MTEANQATLAQAPVEYLDLPALTDLLQRIFLRHGTSAEVARVLADNCARAERDGSHSHGVFRIPGYLSSLASGWVNGQAVPQVEDVAPGVVAVDAGGGFAQPALAAARELLLSKARSAGIAVLAIRNSHHFAALWPDVEPFAEEGLVALSLVNSMTCVVPHGAQRPLFGTNPIAFAAPARAPSRLSSTWPPAPLPTAMCRSPNARASSCRRGWGWTATASPLATRQRFSTAAPCCLLAGTRARRCR